MENAGVCTRLVKILERPAGQQFAPFQGLLESGAFGASAALILFFDIAGGARRFAQSWKEKRLHRAHERTEDLYLHGLGEVVVARRSEEENHRRSHETKLSC